MIQAWYIDAWSVMDGIAFASLRTARDWSSASLTPAATTVIVGPPDWRAVSIARVTTALRATRGPFQESVFDGNGTEIAFDSLNGIIDVVRRGYLAGGLGLDDPGPVEPLIPERPTRPREDTWARVADQLLTLKTADARSHAALSLTRVFTDRRQHASLTHLFITLTAHLRPWFHSTRPERRRDWSDYLQWLSVAWHGLGLRDDPLAHAYIEAIHQIDPYVGRYGMFAAPFRPAQRLQPLRLLFRLPALGQYPEYPRIMTLGDQLLLACASRRCLRSLDTADAFAPLVMAAVIVAATVQGVQIRGDSVDQELVLQPAMAWLSQMLPPARDDNSAQEQMIEELVHNIAMRRFGTTETATPSSDDSSSASSMTA